MEEIPGKDNYIGYLEDDALGETAKVRKTGALNLSAIKRCGP